MNIAIEPGLELASVRKINGSRPDYDSYLIRIVVSQEKDDTWRYLRNHAENGTLPEDFDGVSHIDISREPDAPADQYAITIGIKPPMGFWQLFEAFDNLDSAWKTALAESGSLDSLEAVKHTYHRAMTAMDKHETDLANAPVFEDTPEGIAGMFGYFHDQMEQAQQTDATDD